MGGSEKPSPEKDRRNKYDIWNEIISTLVISPRIGMNLFAYSCGIRVFIDSLLGIMSV